MMHDHDEESGTYPRTDVIAGRKHCWKVCHPNYYSWKRNVALL